MQEIIFKENLERAGNTKMFFIVEEVKITSHKGLLKYCKFVLQTYLVRGVIMLNGSNNSLFLCLKIYGNRQAFDLILASGI